MMYLLNYDDSAYSTHERFLFDSATRTVMTESVKSANQLKINAAGWGWMAPLKRESTSNPPFVAVYIAGRSIRIWLENKEILLTDDLCAVFTEGAIENRLLIREHETVLADCRYASSCFAEQASDLLRFIAKLVNDARERKLFAYRFSAYLHGKERVLPRSGFTPEVIDAIGDPFDIETDISDLSG